MSPGPGSDALGDSLPSPEEVRDVFDELAPRPRPPDLLPPLRRPGGLAERFRGLLVPCFAAFVASFCIMTLELVAGRIIAKHLGHSLQTWTSVICVVLAGITVGNYAGGWIADFMSPRIALAALFFAGSLGAFAIPFINDWVGTWNWKNLLAKTGEEDYSWSNRILLHVTVVFFAPSVLLGLISPVVAKMALELRGAVGRTVGSVYAWGAAGSIAGTYVTGFYLIEAFGMMAVVCGVSIVLVFMGCLFASPIFCALAPPALAVAIFVSFGGLSADSSLKLVKHGSLFRIAERDDLDENVIHVDESQYAFIKVERYLTIDSKDGEPRPTKDIRKLYLDHLLHSEIDLLNIEHLRYDYECTYRAVVHRAAPEGQPLRTLFIGGGGFVFPRFVAHRYPGSHIQVAEIDPAVTEANFAAFGLLPSEAVVVHGPLETRTGQAPIWIRNLDARNHVEDLVQKKRAGASIDFDFVFGDAFNDFSVPFHLTTREFNLKIRELLTPEKGVYLINVIDIFGKGRFLGAVINTFKAVFPFVEVYCNTEDGPGENRDTFVVVGSLRRLENNDLPTAEGPTAFEGSRLKEEHLEELRKRSKGLVLTDDHAPVEQLLAEVVNRH
jgi:predicted membrane-bound spermidine synthase